MDKLSVLKNLFFQASFVTNFQFFRLQFLSINFLGNPNIKLYDCLTDRSEPVVVFVGHSMNVTSIGFQRDNRWMFSASEDGTLKIWDLR